MCIASLDNLSMFALARRAGLCGALYGIVRHAHILPCLCVLGVQTSVCVLRAICDICVKKFFIPGRHSVLPFCDVSASKLLFDNCSAVYGAIAIHLWYNAPQ